MKQKIELPEVAMFSVKTASEVSSFSERYWIERIRREEIPIIRIGRSVRIHTQDLFTFLKGKIEEGSEADTVQTPEAKEDTAPKKRSVRRRPIKKSEA